MAPKQETATKYHLVLTDGTERDVTGYTLVITPCGALAIEAKTGDALVAYAPGMWKLAENERKDE
jgi:hypothetical protein